MKTIRFLILLAGLGAWMQHPGFSEPSAPATPKAASQPAKAVPETHAQDSGDNVANHQEKGNKEAGKEKHMESAPSIGKGEAMAAGASSASPRALNAHRHAIVQRQIRQARENQPHYGEKPIGNRQAGTGVANAGAQRTLSQGKFAGTADGKSVASKPISRPIHSVIAPASNLPTAPAAKTVNGRSPGLASIGGATKMAALHNSALSGNNVKLRP